MVPGVLLLGDPRVSDYVGTGLLHFATLLGMFLLGSRCFGVKAACLAVLLYGRPGATCCTSSKASRAPRSSPFPAGMVAVESHGNVLTASAFLYGMAAEELKPGELDARDPDYQVVITVRATRPA
jgi:hypothetical protein